MSNTHSLPEGLDEVEISELMEVNKSLKNFDVEVIPAEQQQRVYSYKWLIQKEKNDKRIFQGQAPLSQVISYSSLVEALSFVEELSDVL